MAQLKEGSIIKKQTGDEVIATLNDISEILDKADLAAKTYTDNAVGDIATALDLINGEVV